MIDDAIKVMETIYDFRQDVKKLINVLEKLSDDEFIKAIIQISKILEKDRELVKQIIYTLEKLDNRAEKIEKIFLREGITFWKNKTDIKTGAEFQESINHGIEAADNFVYLIYPVYM